MARLLVLVLVVVVAAVFGVAVSRREEPPPRVRSPWSPELLRLIEATRPGEPGRKVAA